MVQPKLVARLDKLTLTLMDFHCRLLSLLCYHVALQAGLCGAPLKIMTRYQII